MEYVKYKRITEVVTKEMLSELFDKIVSDGFQIIAYNEKILDSGIHNDSLRKSDNTERILVNIVCGKPNEGKELLMG